MFISSVGGFFASCSQDRTAKLWVSDRIYPVRTFAGHNLDVDVSYSDLLNFSYALYYFAFIIHIDSLFVMISYYNKSYLPEFFFFFISQVYVNMVNSILQSLSML